MSQHGPVHADIDEALESALRAGKSAGCTELEAVARRISRCQIVVEHNESRSGTTVEAQELHVRAVRGKRVGVAFVNSLSKGDAARCAKQAARIAKIRPANTQWPGLPARSGKHRRMRGSSNDCVDSVGITELSDWCDEMTNAALGVGAGVTVTSGSVVSESCLCGIANTHSVSSYDRRALLEAVCSCVSGYGESVTPDCTDGQTSCSTDIDFAGIGATAAELAILSSEPAKSRSGRFDVVFSSQALGYSDGGLLKWIMGPALSGEYVVRGKTFLGDMIGERVASRKFTLVENPVADTRTGARAFDDEGVPTRKTVLIRNGVLEGFLWNTYFASLAGMESTGNAHRDPWTGSLSISPFNLEILPGKGGWGDLVKDVDDGYFVWGCQGAHTSNVEAGKFSFVASPGFRIRDGEIIGGVRETMISGGMVDLLRSLQAVGSDAEDMRDCVFPSLRFRGVRVTTG